MGTCTVEWVKETTSFFEGFVKAQHSLNDFLVREPSGVTMSIFVCLMDLESFHFAGNRHILSFVSSSSDL